MSGPQEGHLPCVSVPRESARRPRRSRARSEIQLRCEHDQSHPPTRNLEKWENLCGNLNQEPRHHGIGDGNLINVAPLQLGEEAAEVHEWSSRESISGDKFQHNRVKGANTYSSGRAIRCHGDLQRYYYGEQPPGVCALQIQRASRTCRRSRSRTSVRNCRRGCTARYPPLLPDHLRLRFSRRSAMNSVLIFSRRMNAGYSSSAALSFRAKPRNRLLLATMSHTGKRAVLDLLYLSVCDR